TLRLASAALIPFHVAPALLLAALAGPFTRRAYGGALAAWLPTWAGFALPLLVWALLSGRWLEGALLLGQAALGLAAGAFLRGPARARRTARRPLRPRPGGSGRRLARPAQLQGLRGPSRRDAPRPRGDLPEGLRRRGGTALRQPLLAAERRGAPAARGARQARRRRPELAVVDAR